jgi:hypothetical protein
MANSIRFCVTEGVDSNDTGDVNLYVCSDPDRELCCTDSEYFSVSVTNEEEEVQPVNGQKSVVRDG